MTSIEYLRLFTQRWRLFLVLCIAGLVAGGLLGIRFGAQSPPQFTGTSTIYFLSPKGSQSFTTFERQLQLASVNSSWYIGTDNDAGPTARQLQVILQGQGIRASIARESGLTPADLEQDLASVTTVDSQTLEFTTLGVTVTDALALARLAADTANDAFATSLNEPKADVRLIAWREEPSTQTDPDRAKEAFLQDPSLFLADLGISSGFPDWTTLADSTVSSISVAAGTSDRLTGKTSEPASLQVVVLGESDEAVRQSLDSFADRLRGFISKEPATSPIYGAVTTNETFIGPSPSYRDPLQEITRSSILGLLIGAALATLWVIVGIYSDPVLRFPSQLLSRPQAQPIIRITGSEEVDTSTEDTVAAPQEVSGYAHLVTYLIGLRRRDSKGVALIPLGQTVNLTEFASALALALTDRNNRVALVDLRSLVSGAQPLSSKGARGISNTEQELASLTNEHDMGVDLANGHVHVLNATQDLSTQPYSAAFWNSLEEVEAQYDTTLYLCDSETTGDTALLVALRTGVAVLHAELGVSYVNDALQRKEELSQLGITTLLTIGDVPDLTPPDTAV